MKIINGFSSRIVDEFSQEDLKILIYSSPNSSSVKLSQSKDRIRGCIQLV